MNILENWHGTTNGYTNHECHCDTCRGAWTDYLYDLRKVRKQRLAKDPDLVPHGRASTYGNWGCRCRPCTDAWAATSARTRHRKAARA